VSPERWAARHAGSESLPDRDPALEQEGADLVDDAGALANQPLTHAMQRLQVELVARLDGHELHRRPLHRLGDRFGIVEVVLLTFGIGAHVSRRHQPSLMPQTDQLAGKMVRPDASLHADEAGRQIGEAALDLAARPLLPQHDAAVAVMADDVERVLADMDADDGDLGACCLGHGVLHLMQPQVQRGSLAGQEHGRTIPLSELAFAVQQSLGGKPGHLVSLTVNAGSTS
jgi:hypothetical protein